MTAHCTPTPDDRFRLKIVGTGQMGQMGTDLFSAEFTADPDTDAIALNNEIK